VSTHTNRAANAKRLLEDPVFIEAGEAIERKILGNLKSAQLDGKADTERYVLELVRMIQAHDRYQRLLWATVDAGKVADDLVERKRMFRGGI
jgi:uncharacterized alpha-E superfamily protein